MITDVDGKPLRRWGIYKFHISGIKQVQILDYSTQGCFKDHCGSGVCTDDVYDAWILLKLIKGERQEGSKDIWVFHLKGFSLHDWVSEGWTLIAHPVTRWFDIWEP